MKWLWFSHMPVISTNGRKAPLWRERLIPKCINSIRLWPEGSLDMVHIMCCVLEWMALFKSAFHVRQVGSKPKSLWDVRDPSSGPAPQCPHIWIGKTPQACWESCAFWLNLAS